MSSPPNTMAYTVTTHSTRVRGHVPSAVDVRQGDVHDRDVW